MKPGSVRRAGLIPSQLYMADVRTYFANRANSILEQAEKGYEEKDETLEKLTEHCSKTVPKGAKGLKKY